MENPRFGVEASPSAVEGDSDLATVEPGQVIERSDFRGARVGRSEDANRGAPYTARIARCRGSKDVEQLTNAGLCDEADKDVNLVACRRLAAELVEDGVSIWLAAEGTRSRDGRIGPLKKGGFHLALGTRAPIVPVAIRGTKDVLRRGSAGARLGMPVEVVIGAPIPVEGKDLDGLVTEVKEFLVANVQRVQAGEAS